MTLKFPKPNFLDQMLRLIGKKRGIIFPSDSFNKHGKYVSFFAKKESFFVALFRPTGRELSEGRIDVFHAGRYYNNDPER